MIKIDCEIRHRQLQRFECLQASRLAEGRGASVLHWDLVLSDHKTTAQTTKISSEKGIIKMREIKEVKQIKQLE